MALVLCEVCMPRILVPLGGFCGLVDGPFFIFPLHLTYRQSLTFLLTFTLFFPSLSNTGEPVLCVWRLYFFLHECACITGD